MNRSVVRQRREYLYQKQKDAVSSSIAEKKEALRNALETYTPIPGHVKRDATKLKHAIELEDEQTRRLHTKEDDEYAQSGIEDPRILITTCHAPSQKLLQFSKEVKLLFPNSVRINRGSLSVKEMFEMARANEFSDVVLVGETRGEPDALTISHLPFGPTIRFTMYHTVMRHDIDGITTLSEQYPNLIFDNFTTALGQRITTILKHLFPVPKADSKRILTFSNESDFIRFRHHTYIKKGTDVVLTELGPRFELRPFEILQGTLEMKDAEREWSLAPYINTARKRKRL